MDLTVLHNITYGMYIVGTEKDGKFAGCVANALTQITSENPIFSLSINKNNYTYEAIRQKGKFSLSILSEETPADWIGTFGYQSSADTDKFSTVPHAVTDGIPYLTEAACGVLLFDVISVTDMETHGVIFARLRNILPMAANSAPMSYSYYHKVIKGKAPKNAPTYQEEAPKEESVSYVCSICGYIYEGDLTKEPDTFRCPICGVPKDKFQKK